MQNLITLWSALDNRRRMIIAGATIAMFLAVLGLSRMANTPGLSLLYAGLDASAAGEVVAALEQRGVVFEVRGDSIHVDAAQRDTLRMTLAGEGLPATGAAGYELLDGLSGFGTTSQMFDAAYWRAKEGELARTILANPQIKSARVHIAQAPAHTFKAAGRSSASVTVKTASGTLPEVQARALRHLVAAAVSGMQPEDVSVIDVVGGLIALGDDNGVPNSSGADRAADLRANVERLLEARVGPGRAVVEVSVDIVTEREEITERSFDPQGRVAISTETEEKTDSSTEPADDVTVASNLPEGDAGTASGGKSQSSETKERVNFEVSETQRALLKVPGSVRKLSVAVLVDGIRTTASDGTVTWEPRPDAELAVLRELVASAVGLDEARGDVLTLKTLAFEAMPETGTLAEASLFPAMGPINVMSVIQLVVLALVALVLGLFVIRPILAGAARPVPQLGADGMPLALPGAEMLEAEPSENGFRVLTGEVDDIGDMGAFPQMSFGGMGDVDLPEDPMTRLRRLIEERQAESVEILRGWLETEEEKA